MADAPIRKRQRHDDGEFCPSWQIRGRSLGDIMRFCGREVTPLHLLFECASGYALFLAHGISQVDTKTFQAVEEYINRSPQPFELIDFLPFSCHQDALLQFNAISKCKFISAFFRVFYPFYTILYFVSSVATVTHKLKDFLKKNLPNPRRNCCPLATSDPHLGGTILMETGLGVHRGILTDDVMRGLRDKIDKLIALEPGALETAQLNLARLHTNTRSPVLVSPSYLPQVRIVPHCFEGFFNIEGKENVLCTRNVVPGEALYGEKLIRVQNEERTEVEYRVWDPLRSKLGAAILGGVTNIWIKPGSRVLYVGNVCGLTVSNLSDLVGSDGLVYVVGVSDDVVAMAGKRPNVVATIAEKYPCGHWYYRMLVGMVDVIFAEIDHCPDHPPRQQVFCPEVNFIVNNAHFYLRAGGHYMISTQVNSSARLVKDPFTRYDRRKEFRPIETVMLDGAYALSVGGYRI